MNENAKINVSVTFRHTESTPALKNYAVEKITHCLSKYVSGESEAHIILSVEKRDHTAEARVHSKRYDVDGKATTGDLYSSIDQVCDTLGVQLRKQKERQVNHKHHDHDAEPA